MKHSGERRKPRVGLAMETSSCLLFDKSKIETNDTSFYNLQGYHGNPFLQQ